METLLPVRPARVWAGRAGSVLAVASAAVHTGGIAGHGIVHTSLLAVMALGCIYCAWHLWKRPTPTGWALTAIMNIAMIALHQNMSSTGSHLGHHGALATAHPVTAMPGSTAAFALAATEVVFATAALFATTRPTAPPQAS
ncbi:hypothetical protein CH278_06080 [Rhodococcus sp. 05-2254-5]|nr:hypothetical protein CH278_06080 [Rhodococcus sp. 05-2254-5]CAH0152669.1 hypothetical protein SRABI91_00748 [Rhodococcus fascians]